ncbi:translocase [Halobacteriales archaeon QS_8_69_26]|nr:MAG: translocase [Halobacteriales archaeon QS_8_69_26]
MSSAIDEDTARTINEGRETAGAMLSTAQTHLQKVFIVFVMGLVLTIMMLRLYVWDWLRANTKSRMSEAVVGQVDIITRTPFDVILVQVKIGLFIGIIMAVPVLLFLSRDSLRERGYTAAAPVGRGKLVAFALLALVLFAGGVVYAYAVFFPFMFSFLASNAINAAIKPSYDIVMYIQFLFILTASFGFAAQLPLMMSLLSYTEVVPYETFRDKWKYAVVLIFGFGAVFSPPDPFTQIMWGIPLCGLYVFSLGLAKLVTNVRRAGASDPTAMSVREAGYYLGGVFVLAAAGVAAFVTQDGLAWVNETVLPELPGRVRPDPLSVEGLIGVGGPTGEAVLSLAGGLAIVAVVVFAFMIKVLNDPVEPRPTPGGASGTGGTGTGEVDFSELNLSTLDVDGIRAAPPEAFLELTEDEALELAQEAIDEGNPEKGRAILDRFDTAEEDAAQEEETAEATFPRESEEDEDVVTSTAAGVADAFTEDETTEEDIGGYYYDVAFVAESLTSKAFRIVGVFMLTMGLSFWWLYQGGLGQIKASFFSRIDPAVLEAAAQGSDPSPSAANYIIALHPVEQLIFEVKVSVIIGAMFAVPMTLYYAYPALKERGLTVGGDRRVFLVWGGSLLGAAGLGLGLGFFYVAPNIISFLVEDALAAGPNGMIISYRLNAFFWLVIFTTAGVGVLADIPVSMILFHYGGLISFQTMYDRWRVVVVTIFALAGYFLPGGVLTMLIVSVPVALAYWVGLALLWLLTFPGRLGGGGGGEAESEEASPA